MNPLFYYILHVFALIVLTAHIFMALALPAPENRKRTMMITGIASLLILVSGFGLWSKIHGMQMQGWIIVKIVCWFGFKALAGLAYRKAHLRGMLSLIGLSLVLVALMMVYLKPF